MSTEIFLSHFETPQLISELPTSEKMKSSFFFCMNFTIHNLLLHTKCTNSIHNPLPQEKNAQIDPPHPRKIDSLLLSLFALVPVKVCNKGKGLQQIYGYLIVTIKYPYIFNKHQSPDIQFLDFPSKTFPKVM